MEMRPLEENTEHEKPGSLVVKPEERGVGGRPWVRLVSVSGPNVEMVPDLQRVILSLIGLGLSG